MTYQVLKGTCQAFDYFPVVYWSNFSDIGQQEGVTCIDIIFLMILCQVLVDFFVVYCEIHRHPEAWKSNMNRHIWLIISWLRLRQLCWFSFCLLWKLLRHWATRRSNMWRHQFFYWSCVRYLFIFLLFTVQTSQTLCTRRALTFEKSYLTYHFQNETVRYLFMFLLFTANFIDIGKHEKVAWKGIYDLSFRDWDCVRYVDFLFVYCANFSDIGQKEWVTLNGVSDISVSQWVCVM